MVANSDPFPWRDRTAVLEALLDRGKQPALSYFEAVRDDGQRVYREACKLGLEGIVSKRCLAQDPLRHRRDRFGRWLRRTQAPRSLACRAPRTAAHLCRPGRAWLG